MGMDSIASRAACLPQEVWNDGLVKPNGPKNSTKLFDPTQPHRASPTVVQTAIPMGPTQQHRASTTVEPAGRLYPARLRLHYDLEWSHHHRASTTVVKISSTSPALCLAGSFKTTLPGTGRYHGNNNDSTAPWASLWNLKRFPVEAGKFQNCALAILRPCARLSSRSWGFLPSLTRAMGSDVKCLTLATSGYALVHQQKALADCQFVFPDAQIAAMLVLMASLNQVF
jgi:hypothetical protein